MVFMASQACSATARKSVAVGVDIRVAVGVGASPQATSATPATASANAMRTALMCKNVVRVLIVPGVYDLSGSFGANL